MSYSHFTPSTRSTLAIATFFALCPAAAAAGALALPVLLGLASILVFSPDLIAPALAKPPAWLLALACALGWIAISALWSPAPLLATSKSVLLVGLGSSFIATAGSAGRTMRAGGAASFLVLALLLAVEAGFDSPLNRAGGADSASVLLHPMRGAIVLLALGWGAAASLAVSGRSWLAGCTLLIGGALSFPFGLSAHVIAYGLGLMAFLAALMQPTTTVRAIAWSLAGWLIAAPFATPLVSQSSGLADTLPLSWAHRLVIWNTFIKEICHHPLIGHGLGASRALGDDIVVRGQSFGPALHPHSASLQLWYETGAIGAVLVAMALVVGGQALARSLGKKPVAAAAAAASLLSLGFVANVSFSLVAEWWVASLLLAAALVAAAAQRGGKSQRVHLLKTETGCAAP